MSILINALVDFIYPKKCLACGKNGVFLCTDCLKLFEYSDQICPECGEGSVMGWTHDKCKSKWNLDGLVVLYDYQDEKVRTLIDEIKFEFNRDLIKLVIESCEFELGLDFEMIVPIPLYFYRENWRGFNQAKEIAIEVEILTNIKCESVLIRKQATKQQSLSKTKEERLKNTKDVFGVRTEALVSGKRVLLIDDVFTSGATLKEACKALKMAGAVSVWGFCLAH